MTALWSFLPISGQPEMLIAWDKSLAWINCCLPLLTGPELERCLPAPGCPKAGF